MKSARKPGDRRGLVKQGEIFTTSVRTFYETTSVPLTALQNFKCKITQKKMRKVPQEAQPSETLTTIALQRHFKDNSGKGFRLRCLLLKEQ